MLCSSIGFNFKHKYTKLSQQGLKATKNVLLNVYFGEKFVIREEREDSARGPALTKLGHLQHELVPVLWPLTSKVEV